MSMDPTFFECLTGLIRSDGAVYDVFQLPSEIKKGRRNHLRHKDDIKIFHGVDPEECGCQAPPVKITFSYRAGCDRVSGGGKTQSESDSLRYWSLKIRPLPSVLTIARQDDCESSALVWVCQSLAAL